MKNFGIIINPDPDDEDEIENYGFIIHTDQEAEGGEQSDE